MAFKEVFLLKKDYFLTLKLSEIFFDWLIPLFITLTLFILNCLNYLNIKLDIFGDLITLLGIFFGFSVTSLSILISNGNKNLNEIKKIDSKFKIGNKKITLYQLLIINISFLLMVEIFLLFYNIFFSIITIPDKILIYFTFIDIFLLISILMINLRNILNIYFVIFKR